MEEDSRPRRFHGKTDQIAGKMVFFMKPRKPISYIIR